MATVDKDIAERLIEKCEKQKRPRVYCICSYNNLIFKKKCYSIIYKREDYNNLRFNGGLHASVKVLWGSEKYEIHAIIEALDREYERIITRRDDRRTLGLIRKHEKNRKS